MVVVEAADFAKVHTSPAAPVIRPLPVCQLSSRQVVTLPVERKGPVLLGPRGKACCVVLDGAGEIAAELQSLIERQAWLSGLSPRRANSCLWESLP